MKLTHAPIVVRNQDEALKFYADVLGFEKRADYQQKGAPRWLTVAPKGDDVELILVEAAYSRIPAQRPMPTTAATTTSSSPTTVEGISSC